MYMNWHLNKKKKERKKENLLYGAESWKIYYCGHTFNVEINVDVNIKPKLTTCALYLKQICLGDLIWHRQNKCEFLHELSLDTVSEKIFLKLIL